MIEAFILSQVRHALTGLGAAMVTWLIAHGAKPEDANVLAAALPIVLSCAASIYDKYHTHKTTVKIPGAGNQ